MAAQWKIDSLRRVRIPIKFLKELDFSEGQELEIAIRKGQICITKFQKEDLQTRSFVGIVRKLDSAGRITIPSEYLNILGFNLGDIVNVSLDDGVIKIKKL